MAQATNPVANLRVAHQDISLKFGTQRSIDFHFAMRDRNWSCLKNATIDSARSQTETEREGVDNEVDKAQLFERERALKSEVQ